MTSLDRSVRAFAKRTSSVKHSGKVVREVARSEIVILNKAIEPKIRQNERERIASMNAAARCVVGGKQYIGFQGMLISYWLSVRLYECYYQVISIEYQKQKKRYSV